MFTAYTVVTLLAAAANIFSAILDFIRFKQILINMARVGVSESWITIFGILKAAGALGLLIGMSVPLIGIAAGSGLVLFFVSAIITHVRTHDYSFGLAIVFLCWPWPRWCCEWPRCEQRDAGFYETFVTLSYAATIDKTIASSIAEIWRHLLLDLFPESTTVRNIRENKLALVEGERAGAVVATER